jgi:hypothetical protein
MMMLEVFTKIFLNDGASQFQNFCVNFHKFQQDEFQKCPWVGTERRDWFPWALPILEGHHEDGDTFLNHIVPVT